MILAPVGMCAMWMRFLLSSGCMSWQEELGELVQ
jgi:hypothetical protein